MANPPLAVDVSLTIPETEIVERFVRASGAGGQNVNKVSSAVELRFDVAGSPSLPEPLRARLLARRDRRLTDEGVLVIDAQRFRTQERNRADARERLADFIRAGLSVPKARVATKPTYGSRLRRLDEKKGRAQLKRGRSQRNWE
ncbi:MULTISPECIES: alternative ribosome rescue aminoacyl-tRNA hydrolase ArfB [Stenotrophomonas]|uniref:Aminoacyl-tRNA hydrolase n=1 Tax=Stenotrophomonas nitritireducens TaxID=83617 RepID=A0A9D8PVH7_9GAMM|nr:MULTISPECIES: alternative ribosome rescue aminoacyl-tRNA hydrolase ArfB [Stenotrophomonas]KQO00402.1 peptidyl-tRNA hydrolase [Stenotrophomonas sp. Leaf70]KRG60631.1 peptidyl-tRNA hydrolase [Stenotrophomonas nitritireducens]MBN8791782.1 aminoacyl-tRNA hydrolase [Stenotrophomonas nitritireducens]MBN8795720.1 aminoacyl-tRNA hydrolase [Stenotrophomonas nitritireducens]MBN8798463.1 aminoacyl-tRNA hydrolase [Stenotrophomonas nitritireducens]